MISLPKATKHTLTQRNSSRSSSKKRSWQHLVVSMFLTTSFFKEEPLFDCSMVTPDSQRTLTLYVSLTSPPLIFQSISTNSPRYLNHNSHFSKRLPQKCKNSKTPSNEASLPQPQKTPCNTSVFTSSLQWCHRITIHCGSCSFPPFTQQYG